jgi:hypothetical protein
MGRFGDPSQHGTSPGRPACYEDVPNDSCEVLAELFVSGVTVHRTQECYISQPVKVSCLTIKWVLNCGEAILA